MLNDNLADIINAVRSELGYQVYRDDTIISDIRREIYWLFRNVMKRPVVPLFDESYIIALTAMCTQAGYGLYIELLSEEDRSVAQILPHAVESFPKVFRAVMQAYLEEMHYSTKPQQAIDYAKQQMLKSLTSQAPQ